MLFRSVADELLVQVAYAIGVAKPVSLTINTYGTSKVKLTDGQIAEKVADIFDMRPKAIVERFGLKYPIYSETAAYGHMGRESYKKDVELSYVSVKDEKGTKTEVRKKTKKSVEFFTWEKLDYVAPVKKAFGIK